MKIKAQTLIFFYIIKQKQSSLDIILIVNIYNKCYNNEYKFIFGFIYGTSKKR